MSWADRVASQTRRASFCVGSTVVNGIMAGFNSYLAFTTGNPLSVAVAPLLIAGMIISGWAACRLLRLRRQSIRQLGKELSRAARTVASRH